MIWPEHSWPSQEAVGRLQEGNQAAREGTVGNPGQPHPAGRLGPSVPPQVSSTELCWGAHWRPVLPGGLSLPQRPRPCPLSELQARGLPRQRGSSNPLPLQLRVRPHSYQPRLSRWSQHSPVKYSRKRQDRPSKDDREQNARCPPSALLRLPLPPGWQPALQPLPGVTTGGRWPWAVPRGHVQQPEGLCATTRKQSSPQVFWLEPH